MNERAGFLDLEPIDVSGFAPEPPKEKASAQQVKKVAEKAQFKSREPQETKSKREPRVYRTGRNTQFNIKTTAAAADAFYRLADQNDWVLGETLERAVAALERELDAGRGQGARSI
jgi:hypothetical protein